MYLLLPDISYNLSNRCFDGDFHLAASAAGTASSFSGATLEITHNPDNLLQFHTATIIFLQHTTQIFLKINCCSFSVVSSRGIANHPGIYPGHLGALSLPIPAWVGAMSTGNGFGHRW